MSYSKLRIDIFSVYNGTHVAIGEIAAHSVNGGPNVLAGGVASASSQWDSNYSPDKALDGNIATMWHTSSGQVTAESWWQYDFAAPVDDLVSISITAASGSGRTNQAPRQFRVRAFEVESNSWVYLSKWGNTPDGTFVETEPWVAGTPKTFSWVPEYAGPTEQMIFQGAVLAVLGASESEQSIQQGVVLAVTGVQDSHQMIQQGAVLMVIDETPKFFRKPRIIN